uniref:OTU domain-containing protein n=1 Tax=Zooxanthella nutricula TaxID=1333877 RepID=A0A7S2LRX5_9DINO
MAPAMRRCPLAAPAALALAPTVVFAAVLKEQPGALESSLLETQEGQPWKTAPYPNWPGLVLNYKWGQTWQEPETPTDLVLGPAPDYLTLGQAKPVGVSTGGDCFYYAMAHHLKKLGFKLAPEQDGGMSGQTAVLDMEVRDLRAITAQYMLEVVPNLWEMQGVKKENKAVFYGLDPKEAFLDVFDGSQQGGNEEAVALSMLFKVRVVWFVPDNQPEMLKKGGPGDLGDTGVVEDQVGTIWLFHGQYSPRKGHWDALVPAGGQIIDPGVAQKEQIVADVTERLNTLRNKAKKTHDDLLNPMPEPQMIIESKIPLGPSDDQVNKVMEYTRVSKEVARQALEIFGNDVAAAIDELFAELEHERNYLN